MQKEIVENKEVYDTSNIIKFHKEKKQIIDYYEESIYALIEYMKNNEQNPSEKTWDKIVINKSYLSSKTIGYISGKGFNKLCRNLRKQINKEKR